MYSTCLYSAVLICFIYFLFYCDLCWLSTIVFCFKCSLFPILFSSTQPMSYLIYIQEHTIILSEVICAWLLFIFKIIIYNQIIMFLYSYFLIAESLHKLWSVLYINKKIVIFLSFPCKHFSFEIWSYVRCNFCLLLSQLPNNANGARNSLMHIPVWCLCIYG